MAIDLLDKPNADITDPDFPLGAVQDDSGVGDGTPVNKLVYNDFHQFFGRLMQLAGISYNGLLDSAADGYQLYEALNNWQDDGTALTITPDTGAVTVASGDYRYNSFVILGKTLQWQLNIVAATISGSPNEIVIDLPASAVTLLGGSPVIANNTGYQIGLYENGSTKEAMPIKLDTTTNTVVLTRMNGAAFANGTNTQNFNFNITIPLA